MTGKVPESRLHTQLLHHELKELAYLDEAVLPELARSFAKGWMAQRGDREIPRRSSFGPLDMPRATLSWVMVWEPVDGDYRCRLAGTGLRSDSGLELTGCLLGELFARKDNVWSEFDGVASGASYCFVERLILWSEAPPMIRTRLLLPLASDDGGPHRLVGLVGPSFRFDCDERGRLSKRANSPL